VSAIILPSKLSELATLGLEALAKIERQPDVYRIEFTYWHLPSAVLNRCLVCFAGAVMATTFELSPLEFSAPGYFLCPNRGRLLALDSLRVGSLAEAAFRAGLGGAEQLRAQPLSRTMPDYRYGNFRSEMERLVDDLKTVDL
jgi:hypothetical protein